MSALEDDDELRDDDYDEREPDEPPARPRRQRDRSRDRGRQRSGKRRPPQEARLRESLVAIGEWLHDRGDDELGDVLKRDAEKMARVCGSLANANPLAKRAVSILADVLEPVRAFGPTLRILWGRLVARRAAALEEREEELAVELVHPEAFVPAPAPEPAEPAQAEPWRIRE